MSVVHSIIFCALLPLLSSNAWNILNFYQSLFLWWLSIFCSIFSVASLLFCPLSGTGSSTLYITDCLSELCNIIKKFILKDINSNIDDSGIYLPVFPSRTNLKLYNISVTPKMVKKVITNLVSSKAFSHDCIPVVVLNYCEPELWYILAELFNMCLEEPCLPDCWKASSVSLVFKNTGERSTAKSHHPVSLLCVVSKVFEKLVNNKNCWSLREKWSYFCFPLRF